jgi:hypothetical protein
MHSVVTGAAYECVKYTCAPLSSPRNKRALRVKSRAFQPTCGTFSRFSASPSSRAIRPFMTPSPATPGASSLPSNSHCMPTQMPNSGVPSRAASPIVWRHSSSSALVAAKWPTPGTMTARASLNSDGRSGVMNSAPRADSAFRTDVRLPAP